MPVTLAILALVFAPAALLFYFFWVRDRWEREPWPLLWALIGLGCLSVIPAAIIEIAFSGLEFDVKTLGQAFTGAFLVAGLTEETVKFVFVYLYTRRARHFQEEYDGIMYTVAVGLGFAFLENILYVGSALVTGQGSLEIAIARAFTAVPSHALDGVIMGYFLGRAHFMDDPADKLKANFQGILYAVLFHGLYDFFAFTLFVIPENMVGWCVAGLFWTLVVEWGTAHRLVRIAQERSATQHRIHAFPILTADAMTTSGETDPSQPEVQIQFHPSTWSRRFCRFCGKPVEPNAQYCRNCGASLA